MHESVAPDTQSLRRRLLRSEIVFKLYLSAVSLVTKPLTSCGRRRRGDDLPFARELRGGGRTSSESAEAVPPRNVERAGELTVGSIVPSFTSGYTVSVGPMLSLKLMS